MEFPPPAGGGRIPGRRLGWLALIATPGSRTGLNAREESVHVLRKSDGIGTPFPPQVVNLRSANRGAQRRPAPTMPNPLGLRCCLSNAERQQPTPVFFQITQQAVWDARLRCRWLSRHLLGSPDKGLFPNLAAVFSEKLFVIFLFLDLQQIVQSVDVLPNPEVFTMVVGMGLHGDLQQFPHDIEFVLMIVDEIFQDPGQIKNLVVIHWKHLARLGLTQILSSGCASHKPVLVLQPLRQTLGLNTRVRQPAHPTMISVRKPGR